MMICAILICVAHKYEAQVFFKEHRKMKNPFVYGEAVTGEHFCNRKEELYRLGNHLSNAQKVFLIAARRLGKTSLVKHVLNDLKRKGIRGIYLDIEGITSYKKFLEIYLTRISQELSLGSKVIGFIKRILPGIGISVNVEQDNSLSMALRYREYDDDLVRAAEQIYKLPEKIAGKKGFVVIFDEFQEITKLNGGNIAAQIRAVIQHQRNVGYVFAGSKRDIIREMADSKDSPFYKIGPMMFLDKIKGAELKEFILEKFRKTKIGISVSAVDRVISIAEGIPYYTQMLAFEVWELGLKQKRIINDEDVTYAYDQLVKQRETYFREKWSGLVLTQRKVLQAIARNDGAHLMSKGTMDKYNLGAVSTVSQAIAQLKKENIIDRDAERYYLDDILFHGWIRKYTA